MKANQLINLLSNLDPEAVIVVNGYEGGFEEPEDPKEIFVSKNEEAVIDGKLPWWEGEYQKANESGKKAILLSRKSRYLK